MKKFLLFLVLVLSASFCFGNDSGGPAKVGDVLFQTSFENVDGWSGTNSKAFSLQNGAVQIDLPAEGKEKNASISMQLPVEKMLGTRLEISAKIQADQVANPPQAWNGIKLMLVLDTPEGKQWLQKNGLDGTFDWKSVRFLAAVPETTTRATLVLGIENTTGRVRFDDVQIKIVGKKPSRKSRTETASVPLYKGHDKSRLRGTMISPGKFGPEDIEVLAGRWKANHVRWQLTWAGFPNGPADTATVEEYNAWIEGQCELLDAMLPECEKYGVLVALDLHTPPGGRLPMKEGSVMRLFHDPKLQDAFVAVWEKLAKRYKNAKAIWCYDILNEPVEGEMPDDETVLPWRELALKTSKVIRKIDPNRALVIEPAPWGSPDSLDWFEPFDPKEVSNVVYSVHMYIPHQFTHQGVHGSKIGIDYPGTIDGKEWNKDQLRRALRAPIEFSRDYGVAIYIGEFSAIRWAPNESACRYLKDCIEIFEEQGWDWAYHAFREWDGWSVEHGSDPKDRKRAAEPTDREQLLRRWFEKK